jgi:hypothetical protein
MRLSSKKELLLSRPILDHLSEGLHGSPDVVYQLRTGTHQHLARADYAHMGLALLAPMLEWVQQLRIEACQAGQDLGIDLVGLSLV